MAEQLPIYAFAIRESDQFMWPPKDGSLPFANAWVALTPHAPAQSALDELRREVERLRELAATCYAGLGAECDLPEAWLDALSQAANGELFSVEGLLPYSASGEVEALRADRDRQNKLIEKLTASLEECVDDTVDVINTYIANYGDQWRPARLNALRDQESRARAALDTARASTDEGVGK